MLKSLLGQFGKNGQATVVVVTNTTHGGEYGHVAVSDLAINSYFFNLTRAAEEEIPRNQSKE